MRRESFVDGCFGDSAVWRPTFTFQKIVCLCHFLYFSSWCEFRANSFSSTFQATFPPLQNINSGVLSQTAVRRKNAGMVM